MIKTTVWCGMIVTLLTIGFPVISAKAQSFVLDPNNTSSKSRGAEPAYQGGVVVPYNPESSRSQYGGYNNRPQTRTYQQQKQTGPIAYGAGQDGGVAGAGNMYGMASENEKPKRVRTPDHEERLLAYRERQKARAAKREQEKRARGASRMEDMMRAKQEYEARVQQQQQKQ